MVQELLEEVEHWKSELESARQLFNQQEEQIKGTVFMF
jgi:BioD-like phosphotransacetylase family protein